MEVATLATRQDLFRILAVLEHRLPKYCEVHQVVLAALLTSNPIYSVYFLSSNGEFDADYSAVVAVKRGYAHDSSNKVQNIYALTGCCLNATDDNNSQILKIHDTLHFIDWQSDAVFLFTKNHQLDSDVNNFLNLRNSIAVKHIYPVDRYFVTIQEATKFEINLPDGVFISSLEGRHAQLIFDNWPYNHTSNVIDLRDEIEQMPSAGLFLKENNKLVSWLVCHPPFGMGLLHTLEDHRRCGYATLVTKYMAKRMAQSGYQPFAGIVVGNETSVRFFKSLGFRLLCSANALFMTPS